jgi:hypothetical protein
LKKSHSIVSGPEKHTKKRLKLSQVRNMQDDLIEPIFRALAQRARRNAKRARRSGSRRKNRLPWKEKKTQNISGGIVTPAPVAALCNSGKGRAISDNHTCKFPCCDRHAI